MAQIPDHITDIKFVEKLYKLGVLEDIPPYLIVELVKKAGGIPDWLDEFLRARGQRNLPLERFGLSAPKPTQVKSARQEIERRTRGGIRKQRRNPLGLPFRIMARTASQAQYQHQALHCMSTVLNLRHGASPFTLIIDDLNQRAVPLITEFIHRGLSRNLNVVLISFESKDAHDSIRLIPAWGLSYNQILDQVELAIKDHRESLVMVDSLYELLEIKDFDMNAFFNLVAVKYNSTLVGTYHQDLVPTINPVAAYSPLPLDTLKFMATCIITCKSFGHVLAIKAAKERSLPEPTHGLLQGAEGIVQCILANDYRGVVLEAEFRRKSGRTISETYFLRPAREDDYHESPHERMFIGALKQEFVVLLSKVPAYNSPEVIGLVNAAANDYNREMEAQNDLVESTFKLSLTDKQKEVRDGVVLPYFDAQKNMGEAGEGGRILYEMGAEDDFDEEEDEI